MTRRPAPSDIDALLPLRKRKEDGARLFQLDEVERRWEEYWVGMPAFEMSDVKSARQIVVHFRSRGDLDRFKSSVGRDLWFIPGGQGSAWYGKDEDYAEPRSLLWETLDDAPPRYPIYVPSVGRWETPLTARALEVLGIPHRVVVEPAQRDDYARALGSDRLLVLPEDYSGRNTGSIPARNWIWEHSVAAGHDRHWVIDDNVRGFLRVQRNRRIAVSGASIFRAAEDFTDRYENVAFSGFNYMYLANDRDANQPPFYLNSRVYSMILVNNSLPYRWRGRYNEDTDICLRALKDGWCTILFNAFLGDKVSTMTMRGGNTDTVYATGDKRRAFAESLVEQHPDVARVVWRYNRWHHEVDYSRFRRNRLRLRPDWTPPADPEYGMTLVRSDRKTRYPTKSNGAEGVVRGDPQGNVDRGAKIGVAGGGAEGDVRAGRPRRVSGRSDGGVRRPRRDLAPAAWRPRP